MAVETILKSWLRSRYTDNNTLKTNFNAGSTLAVPDTSNSSATATDMNTLLTSLRAMQSNVYLRHSPLWSSVNITAVSAGTLIAQTKKTDIDNLTADLLQMCANYSKELQGSCVENSRASDFTRDGRSTGNSNDSRSSGNSNNSRSSGDTNKGSNASGFSSNFVPNSNFGNFSRSSGNTRYERLSTFSNNTGNFSATFCSSNCINNCFRANFSRNDNSSGNTNNRNKDGSSFSQNNARASGFTRNSESSGNSRDSRSSGDANNSRSTGDTNKTSNAIAFSNDTRFSQQFNYSFIVKSDRSVITNSRTTAE